jgi:hypothetical protein
MKTTKERTTSHHESNVNANRRAASAGTELFDQTIKSYEHAIRTGISLQEDTVRCWTNFLNQSSLTQDWQRRVNSVVAEAIPTAERNLEESLRLIDQSSKTGFNLLKRAVEAPRSNGAADMQEQVQEIWQSSLNVLQSNLQAITESQARVMESWAEFVRKNMANAASAAAAAR